MGALISLIALGFMGAILSVGSTRRSENLPIVHFANKPAILPVKKGKNSDEVHSVSLRTLLETRCPSLFTEFNPIWWLFNGHLQTIYCVLGNFSGQDRMSYLRQYLRLADGGTLGIDFAPIDQKSLKDDAPIVVVQHGLTGGSYESYVRAILSRACAPVEQGGLGYRAVVINFRGCADVPITSPLLYSAGHTDDTRQALAYIAHRYPKARLLGLGFSLGSNVLTRYIGEEGSYSRLHSCCALACPWNLRDNNHGLLNSFLGKHIYSKGMGGNLLNLLKKHFHSISADPTHYVAIAANTAVQLKNPTLETFDDTFTRIAGGPSPHFPFPSADEYYQWGSSDKMVGHITVPFLAINAADDPVVRRVPMDGGGNGLVVMELTKGGGHLGWFQQGAGFVDRWTTKPVLEWLKLVGEDLVVETGSNGRKLYLDEDGFLREDGQTHLGCKEGESCIISGNAGKAGILQGL